MKRKIAIFGGSGFIGKELEFYFLEKGDEVITYSRKARNWDPEIEYIDLSSLKGVDVVINLAGESIFGRWTKEKMARMRNSRLIPTAFLVKVLKNLPLPPKLYIGASAMGYYGNHCTEALTEKSEPGNDFLADLCLAWEKCAQPLHEVMRICFARFGLVLGKGGALQKMVLPFKLGIGSEIGSGKQKISWIAVDDLTRAMEHVIFHEEIKGGINFTSPSTVSNHEFSVALAHAVRMPVLFTVPQWVLHFLFKEGSVIYLSHLQVTPEVLMKSGFIFHYPTLELAFKKYI